MFTAEWPRSPLSGVQSHPIVAHTNLDGFCTLDVFGGRFDQQRLDCGILLLHDRPLMGLSGWMSKVDRVFVGPLFLAVSICY